MSKCPLSIIKLFILNKILLFHSSFTLHKTKLQIIISNFSFFEMISSIFSIILAFESHLFFNISKSISKTEHLIYCDIELVILHFPAP